jgi:rhomboid protease GluP
VSYALPVAKPIATWCLLAAIIVVFVAEALAGGSTQTDVLVRLGAKVTPLIAAGEYWRLLTSMFLHIGYAHLFFNGYALIALGTELERMLGWRRFLIVYSLSGLFGSLVSYAFSTNLAAGASGAIFGLVGALAAFFTLHRRHLGAWGQRRLANIVFLVAVNLFLGFTQAGVDNLAHLGGLLSGLGLGWALAPRYQIDPLSFRLIDGNRARRYWPWLILAVAILVGGSILATLRQSDNAESHLWLASYAIEQEDWDEVVLELEHIAESNPELVDADLCFYLGLAHSFLDDYPQAIESYKAALALDPNHSSAHWNLALIFFQMDQFAEARAHFETYLELNPDQAQEVAPYLEELRRIVP